MFTLLRTSPLSLTMLIYKLLKFVGIENYAVLRNFVIFIVIFLAHFYRFLCTIFITHENYDFILCFKILKTQILAITRVPTLNTILFAYIICYSVGSRQFFTRFFSLAISM